MQKKQSEIADFLTCPLSQEIMFDPVVASDGKTYEREKIEKYFAENKGKKLLSPMDNQTEMTTVLTPNDALRSIIQEFLTTNPNMKTELYFSETIKQECEIAIKIQDNIKLKQLLEREPRLLETTFSNKKTCLELSCEQGDLAIFKLAIEKLNRVNLFQSNEKETLQVLRSCYQNTKIGVSGIKEVIEKTLGPDKAMQLSFFKARVIEGDMTLVAAFIESKLLNMDSIGEQSDTVLHIAASADQGEIIQYFINKGMDTKRLNSNGKTASKLLAKTITWN